MPFVARVRETGERLDMTRLADPRRAMLAYKPGDIICQICDEPMIPRVGMVISPHFAHRPRTECSKLYVSHPESPEHLLGKSQIADFAREEWAGTGVRVELEVPIPEVRRIADVMAIWPDGRRIAYECQLAAITTRELAERTEDYLYAGVEVIWWLGNRAATDANREWVIRESGHPVLELHFATRRKTTSQLARDRGFSYRDLRPLPV